MRVNYELPFGKSATGFIKTAIGGWQVNAIAFWQSGEPYTVTDGQNLINLPNISVGPPESGLRPVLPGVEPVDSRLDQLQCLPAAAHRQSRERRTCSVLRPAMERPGLLGLQGLRVHGKVPAVVPRRGLQHHEHPELRASELRHFQLDGEPQPRGHSDQRGSIRPDHVHQHRFYAPRDAVGAEDDVLVAALSRERMG